MSKRRHWAWHTTACCSNLCCLFCHAGVLQCAFVVNNTGNVALEEFSVYWDADNCSTAWLEPAAGLQCLLLVPVSPQQLAEGATVQLNLPVYATPMGLTTQLDVQYTGNMSVDLSLVLVITVLEPSPSPAPPILAAAMEVAVDADSCVVPAQAGTKKC